MLHSETFVRIVHADRVRDLERMATARRLLAPVESPAPTRVPEPGQRVAPSTGRGACGDSAGVPA